MKQLYMSSYHLKPSTIGYYVDELRRCRVRYVLGYSSALYELARGIEKQNLSPPKLDIVMTNAETLYKFQRETISSAFGCPVIESYGMAEMAASASECSNQRLHEWPDAGYIERPRESPEGSFKFICTGLVNDDMPLIRYEVGDSGRFSSDVWSVIELCP